MSICTSNKLNLLKIACVFTAFFLCTFLSKAQDSVAAKKKWDFLAEPYINFPNLKGNTGIGTFPDAEVDSDPGEVFSHFKTGAIFYFEMAKDKWAFSSDLIYINLDEDADPGKIINSGNVNLKQFSWELAGLRKLLPWLEAGIGGRLYSITAKMDLITKDPGGGSSERSWSMTQTWFDPIIVARVKSEAHRKFVYQFRADAGGFGVGSKFAWQVQAYAGYRFSKLIQVTAGYKLISVDYNKGSGADRFLFDVDTFGPVIRLGFNL